ncbi:hypothetical protein Tco_1544399 [Tanacetum coccineum]
MLTDAIKQSESYQMFIKYSTGQIGPKKSRGKGSQGKKTADDSQETVDVSEEYEPEPKAAKKKTSSKRRVKKKVTLSAENNIISDDPDALELGKSISQTEAEEAEAARQVHTTHARIVTEYVPKSPNKKSGGRSSKSVVIQYTPSAPKSKPATSKSKLKGAPSLTPVEQEAANIMQALKERVPDESTIVFANSSEGTGIKPGFPDEEKDITKEKKDDKDGDADDEGDDHISDTQDADDEDVETESDEDNFISDEEITDATKADPEKNLEVKDDLKKTKLPS